MSFPKAFSELVKALSRFPGVGRRSAERIAFYILKLAPGDAADLADHIKNINQYIKPCNICNNFTSKEVCSICSNPHREQDVVCVVEEPKDIVAIEKTSQFNGVYYVLLGAISPLEGVGGIDLNVRKLVSRVQQGTIKEVIISTDPDNDGELTAQYVTKMLSPYNVKICRIAIGIPLGTQIEYIDSATLGKALVERKAVGERRVSI